MNKIISLNQFVGQVEGNITSDMDGEKVMLSITNGKYYNLGEVGGDIWDLIQEPKLIKSIIHEMLNKYEVEEGICKEQVISFLSLLMEEDLIKVVEIDK